jgi:hypothetical protein
VPTIEYSEAAPPAKPWALTADDGTVTFHRTKANATALAVELKRYDPREHRDDHGRWTDGGAASTAPADVVRHSFPAVRGAGQTTRAPVEHPLWTRDEQLAVQRYVGSPASFNINEALRGKRPMSEQTRETVALIDSAIEKAGPLGHRVHVERFFKQTPKSLGLEPGVTATDRGFMSAAGKLDRWHPAVMELDVDPRVKALWGANPDEDELVIQRGSRIAVTDVRVEGVYPKKFWRVTGTVLPPER